MAKLIDISGYKSVLKVRYAYRFDIGGALMRICQFTTNIGTVSMLTLSGYSALTSGTVASTIALALFLISPQISRVIDQRGQSKIVPIASAVSLLGLLLMILTVSLHWHIALCYIGGLLTGCMPSAPSLVRTRWTYLIQTGKLGNAAPDLKTVYSYEGVIDDVSFMIGPAMAISLGTAIAPVAGLVAMAIALAVGTVLLVSERTSDPGGAWQSTATSPEQTEAASAKTGKRSMFIESGAVRVLFVTSLLMGTYFGVLNATEVNFTAALGHPEAASIALVVCSIISSVVGIVFGAIRIKGPLYRQFVVLGVVLGCAYSTMSFITTIPALFAVSWIAILFYAPFLITSNSMCEAHVPGERLTESMTWMNAGTSCGMAIGPTLAGFFIDTFNMQAGFASGGAMAALLAIITLASTPLWRKKHREQQR